MDFWQPLYSPSTSNVSKFSSPKCPTSFIRNLGQGRDGWDLWARAQRLCIKLNKLEIRVTAPVRLAAHPWSRTGQAGQPCLRGGAPEDIPVPSKADCTSVALWRPESISKVGLIAGAGAWGLLYLPSPGKGKP